jgi:imidazolonepropionase-like amidohydrolase
MKKGIAVVLAAVLYVGGSVVAKAQSAFVSSADEQNNATVDIVIRNGRVMDPETQTDEVLTVAIDDGRIVALGLAAEAFRASREIDADGLVVAPGFIDLLARLRPEPENQRYKAMDGVTAVFNMHGGPVDLRPPPRTRSTR